MALNHGELKALADQPQLALLTQRAAGQLFKAHLTKQVVDKALTRGIAAGSPCRKRHLRKQSRRELDAIAERPRSCSALAPEQVLQSLQHFVRASVGMAALSAKLMALSRSPTRHAGQRIMQSTCVARLCGARVIGVRRPKQRQSGMADLVGKVRRERVAPDEGFRAAKNHAKLRKAAVLHTANVGVAWLWGPQEDGLKAIFEQEVY